MIWSRKARKGKKVRPGGQSLIEFALVLPVLLTLMVFLIEFGVLFYTQLVVTHAAWEGARAGATIVEPARGDEEITAAVINSAWGLVPEKLVVDIDPTQDEYPRNQPWPKPRGEELSVVVGYELQLTLPDITLPITGKAVTRMEYQNP